MMISNYRKFTIVNPGGGGLKEIFAPGVKLNFFDFDPGIQYIFDKLIVMDTCFCIFYTSLVKM